MKIAKDDIEVKMEIPGAIIRQKTDFGDATGLGKISGECFRASLQELTRPLSIKGLEETCASVPTGDLRCVASLPQPIRTVSRGFVIY